MLLPLTTDQQQWVETTLNAMTLPQAVGQLLCPANPRFTTADWAALLTNVAISKPLRRWRTKASLSYAVVTISLSTYKQAVVS